MRDSSAAVSRNAPWPRGARIALACFMFAVSGLVMWDEFSRFNWVAYLCLGVYYLIFQERQRGESTKTYYGKPRNILSFVLLVLVIASSLNSLHHLFVKYW
jgi:hypothetical protein